MRGGRTDASPPAAGAGENFACETLGGGPVDTHLLLDEMTMTATERVKLVTFLHYLICRGCFAYFLHCDTSLTRARARTPEK